MNRAVMAARAQSNGRGATSSTGQPVSRNLLARAQTTTQPYGFTGTRRHGNKAKMTGAQRNSQGKRSEWNNSMYPDFTDPKWSRTVSDPA